MFFNIKTLPNVKTVQTVNINKWENYDKILKRKYYYGTNYNTENKYAIKNNSFKSIYRLTQHRSVLKILYQIVFTIS